MKPLLSKDINSFLERFDNFRDAEFREITPTSATTISMIFAIQDSARAFDWITITLEFSGVSDAKIIENQKLSLIDMSDGVSIIKSENEYGFGVGSAQSISGIKNATVFAISSNIKYEEGLF